MRLIAQLPEHCFVPIGRKPQTLAATLALLLLTALSGFAQGAAKKPISSTTKGQLDVKEELILKNDDRLTGQLLNSTGKEIKFKSDLAGEVTIAWENVKELKSKRDFAVVPKDVKNARDSATVPQGTISIGEKGIVVSTISGTTAAASGAMTEAKPENLTLPSTAVAPTKEVSSSFRGRDLLSMTPRI